MRGSWYRCSPNASDHTGEDCTRRIQYVALRIHCRYAIPVYLSTDNVLYFGCRSAREDYYYSEEWEAAAQVGKLSFSVAFSRDQVDIFNYFLDGMLISLPGQESIRARFDRARFVQNLGSGGQTKSLDLHFWVSGTDLAFLMCLFLE